MDAPPCSELQDVPTWHRGHLLRLAHVHRQRRPPHLLVARRLLASRLEGYENTVRQHVGGDFGKESAEDLAAFLAVLGPESGSQLLDSSR